MNIYNANEIKKKVAISQYFKDQGVPIHGNNRAVAIWRDGHNPSVAFDDAKGAWYDHVVGAGGSVIDAYIAIEGGTPLEAVRVLGDRYHLEPVKVAKSRPRTRAEHLIADGYALVATYTYTDENGEPLYFVDRFERVTMDENGLEEKEKEFVQRSPTAENLDGVRRVLYNLPAVIKSRQVFLVEGEKDAETMRNLGLVATTNSGGANKGWNPDDNAVFAGKDVIILPDNDTVGIQHGKNVFNTLRPVARSIKMCVVSAIPKGDITDYIEQEGGSLAGLLEKIKLSETPENERPDIARAKLANETPLLNYVEVEGKNKKKPARIPRLVDDIVKDIHNRFLDFPRRLGGVLFDFGKDNGKILALQNKDELHAWVNGTSGHQSEFEGGNKYASWAEVFARLNQTAVCYNGIAAAPWFPARADVFPTYAALPPPDPTHSHFNELMQFFRPATPEDATLIRAFFLAPMFYNGHSDRPAWAIDTVDAQASGKTSLVKACANLYAETYLDMDLKTVDGDINQLKKRILSSEGRSKRIALFDNLEKTIKSGNLANFVTAAAITGMAPYGRGEETRANDLTWIFTCNGAEVDTDMATRTYPIHIRAPQVYSPEWGEKLHTFIEDNRLQILSDMLDMLQNAPKRMRKRSRFGAFDSCVLSAACENDAEFNAVDDKITDAATAANEDGDRADELVELLTNALASFDPSKTGILPGHAMIIRSTDLDDILRRSQGALRSWTSKRVRRLIKTGICDAHFNRDFERVQTGSFRDFKNTRSFLFFPSEFQPHFGEVDTQFITFAGGIPKVAITGKLTVEERK